MLLAGCYYQRVNGRLHLAEDDCPNHNCPADGGASPGPEGEIVLVPCTL